MYRRQPKLVLTLLAALMAFSCGQKTNTDQQPRESPISHTTPTLPVFDAKEAFHFLTSQTDFGPRNPGSAGHERCMNYLARELGLYAEAVNLQTFTHTGYAGERLTMTNIIASFNLKATNRIMLCAHWDTRPRAEMDPDSSKRSSPILGANDGASGVAVLLELARLFKSSPPPVGIDIVFFDGEDFGAPHDLQNYFLGSRYFADHKSPGFNPRCAILLDLVGDKNLRLPREGFSIQFAPAIVQAVWETAHELGLPQFSDSEGGSIEDDHIPLNSAGIPTIDIIDLELVGGSSDPGRNYWHTHQDTADRCSPASLDAVGKVLVAFLYNKAGQI